MTQKNLKSELDDIFSSFDVFVKAKQHLSRESTEITNATKTSINNAVSATSESGEKRQELLDDAQVHAEKAGKLLLQLHQRLAKDYGRFWRQDLITSQLFAIPEQEIVEAFALLAVIKQTTLPLRLVHFRTQGPSSYLKTKTTLKVSGEPYIFGLLDCVGELDRILHDSLKSNQIEFVKQIFKQMDELYTGLERFREFPNRKDPKKSKEFANLKKRIDTCQYQVFRCRKLLEDKNIL